MKTFTHHIGQLFLLGDRQGLHPNTPMLEDCHDDMVLDYLTDWLAFQYTDGRITAKDLRIYLLIFDETRPEMLKCLYSWLQAEH